MPRLLPLGDAAWTVEFGDTIDAATHARVMGFDHALQEAGPLPGVVEWVPTFRSCTVHFDPLAAGAATHRAPQLKKAPPPPPPPVAGRRWRIPILFGGEAGPDLAELAAHCGLTEQAVEARVWGTVLRG